MEPTQTIIQVYPFFRTRHGHESTPDILRTDLQNPDPTGIQTKVT